MRTHAVSAALCWLTLFLDDAFSYTNSFQNVKVTQARSLNFAPPQALFLMGGQPGLCNQRRTLPEPGFTVRMTATHPLQKGTESRTAVPDKAQNQVLYYDTTLRDGAQGEGISLSCDDKLRIALRLHKFGVHYIEGGYAPRLQFLFVMGATSPVCAIEYGFGIPPKLDNMERTDGQLLVAGRAHA